MCSIFAVVLCVTLVRSVQGHGRLIEPPSRASMWRYGYKTPKNYADNQLFCGGYTVQWEKNEGKCGVCGDPWEGPREHEAGGKYATGIIVRHYDPGSTIHVIVDLTATHKGWFEFRICPNNDPTKAITHECLDQHVLQLANGTGTRFSITDPLPQKYQIPLKLPPTLKCSQCVLQWKYNAGNNWGVDDQGQGCVGCGPQEQFYACADIAIGDMNQATSTLPSPAPLRGMVQEWVIKEKKKVHKKAALIKEKKDQRKLEPKTAEDLGVHIPAEHFLDFRSRFHQPPGHQEEHPTDYESTDDEEDAPSFTVFGLLHRLQEVDQLRKESYPNLTPDAPVSSSEMLPPADIGNDTKAQPLSEEYSDYDNLTQEIKSEMLMELTEGGKDSTSVDESTKTVELSVEYDDYSGEIVDDLEDDGESVEQSATHSHAPVSGTDDLRVDVATTDYTTDHTPTMIVSRDYGDFSDERDDNGLSDEGGWMPSPGWQDAGLFDNPNQIHKPTWAQNNQASYEDFVHYPRANRVNRPVNYYYDFYQNDQSFVNVLNQQNHPWAPDTYQAEGDTSIETQEDTSSHDVEDAAEGGPLPGSNDDASHEETKSDIKEISTKDIVSKALDTSRNTRVELWRKSIKERFAKISQGGQPAKSEGTTIPTLFQP